MSLLRSIIAEQGSGLVSSEQLGLNPAYINHLRGSIDLLSVCSLGDLKKASDEARRDPSDTSTSNLVSASDVYAWLRVPVFLDRFKQLREVMLKTYPHEAIVALDIGAAFGIYPEARRSIWFRKCGDLASLITGLTLDGVSDIGEDINADRRMTNMIHAEHGARGTEFYRTLTSHIQISLATIPLELSGDRLKIQDYIRHSIIYLGHNATQIIDREDRRDYSSPSLQAVAERMNMKVEDERYIPIERRWRVDAFNDTLSGTTAAEQITNTSRIIVDPKVSEQVGYLFELAKLAKREGDSDTANQYRKEANQIKAESTRAYRFDPEKIGRFYVAIASRAAAFAVTHGYACPARFMSLDMLDPKVIAHEAELGMDEEAKATGMFRRERERLIKGDPDHITCRIEDAGYDPRIPDKLSLITSIESWPFYTEAPKTYTEADEMAAYVAEAMVNLGLKLKPFGEYITFPWGIINHSDEPGQESDIIGSSARLRVARQRLIDTVNGMLAGYTYKGTFRKIHERFSVMEVKDWMTNGEETHLATKSPIFRMIEGGNEFQTEIELLRLRREKLRIRSGDHTGKKKHRIKP